MKSPKRILIIKRDDLSAFVLSMAAMRHLREVHAGAHITLVTDQAFVALAKAAPYFDRVTAEEPTAKGVKADGIERIYDFDGSAKSAGLRRKLWPVGPSWSGPAPAKSGQHLLERQAAQLHAAGDWPDAPTTPGAAPPPDLSWIAKKVTTAQQGPCIVMAPGGPRDRSWPEAAFGKAAAEFRKRGFDVVIVGALEEGALARAIQRVEPKARDLTGRTDPAQIAALAARAKLVIGNENSLAELMAAAGPPMLSLYPTARDPTLSAPRGHVAVLQAANLADLEVDQVLRAAGNLIDIPA